jgi:HEAT repeat protein
MTEDSFELDFHTVFLLGVFDDDVQVRAQSIKALWEYQEDDLVPVLLNLLHDPEAIVRAEAALALGRYLFGYEVLDRYDELAGEIETALRAVIHDESELTDVRGRALEAVGVRPHEWVHDLIDEAYASGDRRLTISAINAMGCNADLEWLPIVLEEMQNEDGERRFEAAVAAGGIADEGAIEMLATLISDEDVEVQEAAITSLGQIGGPAARSVLLQVAADSTDERVLEVVTDALAEADFGDDPLGFKLHLDQSVADDADEEELD